MRDVIADYQALVGSVFEALTAIADPNETVIRVQDVHLFPTNALQDALDILYPFFAGANEYVEKTAASYGIPVAHVFNEFAGPDGSVNAEEAGLIGPDHRHPTVDCSGSSSQVHWPVAVAKEVTPPPATWQTIRPCNGS
jgi:hypothetical protein